MVFWHEVTDGLVDYGHVRSHQVANGLYLPRSNCGSMEKVFSWAPSSFLPASKEEKW